MIQSFDATPGKAWLALLARVMLVKAIYIYVGYLGVAHGLAFVIQNNNCDIILIS